jgi:hypothetical protein
MGPQIFSNDIPIRSLWPEVLAIVAGAIYLTCIKIVAVQNPSAWRKVRLLFFLGFLACAYAIYLGIWPSIYSFASLFVVLSPFAFAVAIVRPNLIVSRPILRAYLTVCVALSCICALSELLWLVHLRSGK